MTRLFPFLAAQRTSGSMEQLAYFVTLQVIPTPRNRIEERREPCAIVTPLLHVPETRWHRSSEMQKKTAGKGGGSLRSDQDNSRAYGF